MTSGERRDSRRFVAALTLLLREGRSVRFRAHGWSMFPAIRDGELITVAPLGGSPVRTGDIVLFRRRRGAVAHRVVGVQVSHGRVMRILARGDAADSPDAPIAPERLLGRVIAVERSAARGPRRVARSRAMSRASGGVLRAGHRVRAALRKMAGLR
jgi:signal peptidase I